MNNNTAEDFFFWLGADGEVTPVTRTEFDTKIEEVRKREKKWREVDVLTDTDDD